MSGNKQEVTQPGSDFRPALERVLQGFGLGPLDEVQTEQLATHYAMMVDWNRRTNLTRIVKPEDAARLHYGESVFAAQFAGGAQRILDIGSGAGFPALPVAVVRTECEVTALEANQKKALFLYEVKDALHLDNFRVLRARLEDVDISPYDLLSSRALDRADEVMPEVLKRLGARQRLLLCCTREMVGHLTANASRPYKVETHDIPESESRLVAIFSL